MTSNTCTRVHYSFTSSRICGLISGGSGMTLTGREVLIILKMVSALPIYTNNTRRKIRTGLNTIVPSDGADRQ